jgi:hypothetical protein
MRQPAQLHKIAWNGHRLRGEGTAVEVVEAGDDQLTQCLLVDVGQPLQIEARLAGAVGPSRASSFSYSANPAEA